MEEIIKLLNETRYGFLATVENGEPRVRPWGFMFEEGGKFYFCTNNTKDVYNQLEATPHVEFSAMNKNFVWVRIRGEIKFIDDVKVKEKVLASNDMVRSMYKTPDNPIFKVFYIEHGTAIKTDFSGQPPVKIEF